MEDVGRKPTEVGRDDVLPRGPGSGGHSEAESSREQGAQQERPEVDEAYVRLLADFDNYKRRMGLLLERARAEGRDELVRALVPVLADLRHAVQAPGRDVEDFQRGIEMILDRFEEVLRSFGYERVPTEGETLDPSRHEAVAMVSSRADRGVIVAEVAPGYTRAGNLVQPARVVVAGRPEAE